MNRLPGKILLTGATGYVGGRLLRVLGERNADIRALARHPGHLSSAMASGVEVVQGDLLDRASLNGLLDGIHTAYYLVHSMGARGNYANLDCEAAENFREAAERAGVKRIIYLGGLGESDSALSPHLQSRQETGRVLAAGSVQVVELRASIVLGSGSLSFEMIRALSERLPVMITPRWVSTMAQPIAIEDLLHYLVLCIDQPLEGNHIFEIGGPDQVSYLDLMREYSRMRGLRRTMISVPFLSPRLSSLWLGLVTPLYARVGRALIESIRNPTLVRDTTALEARSSMCDPWVSPMQSAGQSATRIGKSPRPAGRMPCPRLGLRAVSPGCASETASWIIAEYALMRPKPRPSRRFWALVGHGAGTSQRGSGCFVAGSTSCSAEWACVAADETPTTFGLATRWISGASRTSNRRVSFGFGPK